jgi:plastocyanin
MRPSLVALVAVAALAFGGVGWAQAADQSVNATGSNTFSPGTVTVVQGDTVTWTRTGGSHNVVFTSGPAFADPASANSSWTTVARQFNVNPGSYTYQCALHGPGGMFDVGMVGTVNVQAAPPTPPPGTPPPGSPPPGPTDPGTPTPPPGGGEPGGSDDPFKVTLKAGDRTPLVGKRFGLSGTVTPARDGRQLQIQRRLGGGKWTTIARVRLKDAGSARSKFSLRLKLAADAVLRARLSGDDERDTGLSQRLRIDVHR